MRRIFIVLIASLVLFAVNPTSIYASCFFKEPPKHAEKADIIVTGTTISRLNAYYIFSVEKYYKGSGSNQLKVRDPRFEHPEVVYSTEIDSTLSPQKRHLLFLNRQENGIYKTAACNGSRPLEDTEVPSEKEVLGDYIPPRQPNLSPTPSNYGEVLRLLPTQYYLGGLAGVFLVGVIIGALIVKYTRKY